MGGRVVLFLFLLPPFFSFRSVSYFAALLEKKKKRNGADFLSLLQLSLEKLTRVRFRVSLMTKCDTWPPEKPPHGPTPWTPCGPPPTCDWELFASAPSYSSIFFFLLFPPTRRFVSGGLVFTSFSPLIDSSNEQKQKKTKKKQKKKRSKKKKDFLSTQHLFLWMCPTYFEDQINVRTRKTQ